MAEAEALERFAFDDQLFALNTDGLWEGRSNGQIWIGESFNGEPEPIGHRDDRHVLLVSGTRGGKGTGIIIPNLCLWPGSCIVIDPKGENAAVTARRRGDGSEYTYGLKQTVRILDPFGEVQLDPALKARYNPLDAIDPKSDFAVDDAGRIAAALVVIENRTDPFWEQAARNLIKALILHVLTSRHFAGRRNLVSVWRLLRQGDWLMSERVRNSGEDQKKTPSGFTLLWHSMKRNGAYNGLIAGEAEQMLDMHERTRSGILKVATTATEFLDGLPMQRLLEASDFDLSSIKTDPAGLTIYLTLPQRYMSTHYRWLRLMISLAVGDMERIKGRPATGHPTLFVLDEFAGLKRMEAVENAAAQAAGFGVKFFFVLQNLPQLREVYGDSWETFIGNSGLRLFFQIDDNFTRNYLAQQLGEREVARQTRSASRSQSTSTSTTHGHTTSITTGATTSQTQGQNFGKSFTRTRGASLGSSINFAGFFGFWPRGRSNQSGTSFSRATSRSRGWSRSKSTSQSRSHSDSTSYSRTESQSQSTTEGWSEAIHKRLLLNPDEIGRFLARIDDPAHPAFPGVVLVLIPGEHPLPAHRVNYFASTWFDAFFDPHPDHPPPPTIAERIRLLAERRRLVPLPPAVPEPPPARRRRWPRYAAAGLFFAAGFAVVSYYYPTITAPTPQPVTAETTPAQAEHPPDKVAAAPSAVAAPLTHPRPTPPAVLDAAKHGNEASKEGDYTEAMKWYLKAAEQNYAPAQNGIGLLYMNGLGVPVDHSKAVFWIRKAAEQNYAPAENNLALLYERNNGGPPNYSEAIKWYRKAADQNLSVSQASLGAFYMSGLGTAVDYAEAMRWSLKAAAQGDGPAELNIGQMYRSGLGVPKNPVLAMQWFQRAASRERDSTDTKGQALYEVGLLYEQGADGIPRDHEQAKAWMLKSAMNQYSKAVIWRRLHGQN